MRDDESRPRKLLPHYRPGPSGAVDLEIPHPPERPVHRLLSRGRSHGRSHHAAGSGCWGPWGALEADHACSLPAPASQAT